MSKNPFIDRSSYVKTLVSGLRVGMFVAELDRPWLESPFLVQGFTIKSQADIRALSHCCRFVYVDGGGRAWASKKANPHRSTIKTVKKGMLSDEGMVIRQAKTVEKNRTGFNLLATLPQRKAYPRTVSMEVEHDHARQLYQDSKASVKKVFAQTRMANLVDTKAAQQVVSSCVASVLRNPDALLWVTRIKNMNDYTAEHSLNVSILAIAFGRHLRLSEAELVKLGLCGLLHDVGKLKVPDIILDKKGRLTPEEFEMMKRHVVDGRDLLKRTKGVFQYVIDVTFNHHERMDGKGYPRELRAAELSDFTRIISIVDSFDAMTSDRCYDSARSNLEALKEIYKGRGSQFDEALALEFISVVGPYPPGTIVELHNRCVGVVLSSQSGKRHLPIVEVMRDSSGAEVTPKAYNLAKVEEGALDRSFLIKTVLKNGDRGIRLENFPVRLMLQPKKPGTDREA